VQTADEVTQLCHLFYADDVNDHRQDVSPSNTPPTATQRLDKVLAELLSTEQQYVKVRICSSFVKISINNLTQQTGNVLAQSVCWLILFCGRPLGVRSKDCSPSVRPPVCPVAYLSRPVSRQLESRADLNYCVPLSIRYFVIEDGHLGRIVSCFMWYVCFTSQSAQLVLGTYAVAYRIRPPRICYANLGILQSHGSSLSRAGYHRTV